MDALPIEGPGPRPVRPTSGVVSGRIFVIFLMVAAFLVATGFGYRTVSTLERLRTEGKVVVGVVDTMTKSTGKSTTYTLGYNFRYGDNYVTGSDQVDANTFNRYTYGGPIEITFLADDPNTHVIERVDKERVQRLIKVWIASTAAGLAVLFAIFITIQVSFADQAKTLGTYVAYEANVRSVSVPSKDKYQIVRVEYDYIDSSGRSIARAPTIPAVYGAKLRAGTSTVVLVDPVGKKDEVLRVTLNMAETGERT